MQQQRQATSAWGTNVQNIVKQAQAVFVAAMAAMLAAAVAFGVSSVQEFQKFESGMAEVFTLLPNLSEDAMGQMEDDILAFSREVGRQTDETIPALYQAISAGVPQENVFDFMKVASDAALGGVTTLETAVDGISSAVNAYGDEVLSAQQASDLMFTAVKGGKTTFEDLSGSLFNVIPTAASLGVEFGNVTAALAAMTAQGTPTSVATTQLRQLLVELSKEGSKAADTFEQLAGQSFVDFIASGGNLQEALQIMEQGAADAGVRLSDMFGSVEAGSAALTLTGQGTQKFTDELNAAATSAGATGEAARTMGETGQQAINQLKAAFEGLKIAIGESLAPTVTSFTQRATEQLDLMTSTTRFNELVGSLRDMGLSVSEINDIVGDGRAQFDLWRTAADMEDDMNRNAEGMRRMQFAIEGANQGLSNQSLYVSESGNSWMHTTNDLNNYVEEQERLYQINQRNESSDRALMNSIRDVGDATAATTALTADSTDAFAANADVVEAAARVSEDLADKAAQVAAQEAAVDPAVRAANLAFEQQQAAAAAAAAALAETNVQMGDYFVAAINAGEGQGLFNTSLDELGTHLVATGGLTAQQAADLDRLQTAYNKAANTVRDYELGIKGANLSDDERNAKIAEQRTLMGNLQGQITSLTGVSGTYTEQNVTATINQDAVNSALFEAADAAGASAVQLAVLGLATGQLSEDQAEAAIKSAILMTAIDELAAAYVAGDLSIAGLRTEMGNLIADVNNMDIDIGESTGTVDLYADSIGTAGTAALEAAGLIGGLAAAAEDAAGTYDIIFDVVTNGEIPNPNGGYQGSSGAGHQAPTDGYASGGWTGAGPLDQIAGFVHRNEFVLPSPVVDALGLPFLEKLRQNALRGVNLTDAAAEQASFNTQGVQPVTNNNRTAQYNLTVNAKEERAQSIVVGNFRRMERMDRIRR